jgi:hypothetical protein
MDLKEIVCHGVDSILPIQNRVQTRAFVVMVYEPSGSMERK